MEINWDFVPDNIASLFFSYVVAYLLYDIVQPRRIPHYHHTSSKPSPNHLISTKLGVDLTSEMGD